MFNKIDFLRKDIRKQTIIDLLLTILVVTFVFLKMVGGLGSLRSQISNLYLLTLPACTLLFLFKGLSNIKIHKTMFLFLFYIVLNIFFCSPDEIFRPWLRFLLFLMLVSLVSPLFQNKYFRNFRNNSLLLICIFSVIVSIISFIFYFIGINMMSIERDDEMLMEYIGIGGWFSGLLIHSMLLGPVSGVATCYMVYVYYQNKRLLSLLILFMCVGSMFFAASRGAIWATLFAFLCSLYFYIKRSRRKESNILKWFFIVLITFPLWNIALEGVRYKETRGDAVGIFGSRTNKFEERFSEIRNSPIFGIGFSAIDKKHGVSSTGTIEPGSSWLAVLSMTGIIGFLFVIFLFVKGFNSCDQNTFQLLLLRPLIVFWAVHMIIEGYFYAAGSSLCFMSWLVLGVANDAKLANKKVVCY